MTQATLSEWAMKQGLDADIQSMSQAEKTMLRYQYVLANSTAAQNDFTRTAGTWANQIRILKQNIEQLGAVIGTGFINALKPLVSALNSAMLKIVSFAQTIVNALGVIFGWKLEISAGAISQDFGEAADSAEDLAGGTGKAAKNIKDMRAGLRDIDELKNNVIDDDKNGGGGGGGGGGLGDMTDLLDAGNKLFSITEQEGLFESEIDTLYKLGEYIGNALNDVLESINWGNVYKGAADFGKGLADFLNGLISPKLFSTVGTTIAKSLNTVLASLYAFGTTFDWGDFGNSLASGLNSALADFNWNLANVNAKTFATGLTNTINGFVRTADFNKVGETIANGINTAFSFALRFVENLDLDAIGIKISDALNGLFNNIKPERLSKAFSTLIRKAISGAGKFIKNADFDAIRKTISNFLSGFDLPGLDLFGKVFDGINWRAIGIAIQNLASAIGKIGVNLGKGLISFLESLQKIATPALSAILTTLSVAIDAFAKAIDLIPDGLLKSLGSAIGAVATSFLLFKGVPSLITAFVGGFRSLVSAVSSGLTALMVFVQTNPLLAIVTGLAAVTAAIATASKGATDSIGGMTTSIQNARVEQQKDIDMLEKYGQSVEDIDEQLEYHRNKIDDINKSYANLNQSTSADIQYAQDLAEKYNELSSKTYLTAEEQKKLHFYSDQLVKTIPELNRYVDEETGLLAAQPGIIDAVIAKKVALYKVEAAEALLKESYEEMISLELELNDARSDEAKALEEMTKAQHEYTVAEEKAKKGDKEAADQLEDLQTKAIAANQSYSKLSSRADELADSQSELQDKIDDVNDIMYENQKVVDSLDYANVETEAMNAVNNAHGVWANGVQVFNQDAINMYNAVIDELGYLPEEAYTMADGTVVEFGRGIKEGEPYLEDSFNQTFVQGLTSELGEGYTVAKDGGGNYALKMAEGLNAKSPEVEKAALNTINKVNNISKGVVPIVAKFSTGNVYNDVNTMLDTIKKMVSKGITASLSIGTKVTGNNKASISVTAKGYAAGGFPEDGWFRASHGEIMGKFDNGKSVVANNNQIVDGIANAVYPAVYNAVSSAMSRSGGNNVTFEVSGDPYGLFNVIKKEADNYFDRNGKPAFAN